MNHAHDTTLGWGVHADGGAEMWDTNPIFRGDRVTLQDRLKLLFYPKKWFTYRYIEKDFRDKMTDRPIEEPYRILDVGCGTGSSVIDFKKMFGRRVDVVGLDVVKLQVDIGNKKIKKSGVVGELVWYDGGQFPFTDHSFDAVYTSDVLGHVPDVEIWLEEVSRVLKPGGVLAMYAESELGRHAYIRRLLRDGGVNIDPHAEFHISLYSGKEIRRFVEETDFKIDVMKSSFLFAFFVHPDEFYPKLQAQKKFFFLRMINRLLVWVKKMTRPVYMAGAEFQGLIEMWLFGDYFEAQGFVVLARKKD